MVATFDMVAGVKPPLAQWFYDFREFLDYTQEQMADMFGVHVTTYQRWERGDIPLRGALRHAQLAALRWGYERELPEPERESRPRFARDDA